MRDTTREKTRSTGRLRATRGRDPLLFALLVVLTASGCSYHRAYVDYDEMPRPIPIRTTAWEGERLGTVRANEGGAIWADCTDVALGSLWVLAHDAEAMGGNALGEIRWFTDESEEPFLEPTCERRWGWLLLWPGLLTPAFMGADVEAVVYRVPEGAELGDRIPLPADETDLRELLGPERGPEPAVARRATSPGP